MGGLQGSTAGLGEIGCRAEELKGLLETLSSQIADADRRQSDAMREMQSRLARLGTQSENLKNSLPQEYASAFERIEEGMAQLADRLTDTSGQATAEHDPVSRTWADEPHAPAQVASSELAFEDERSHADEPAVERRGDWASDNQAQSITAAGPVAADLPAPEHAHSSRFSAEQPSPDEPWDRQTAEALARLYDSSEIGLPRHRMFDDLAPSHPASAASQLAPAQTPVNAGSISAPAVAASSSAFADIEKAWLESKLADIAARVEQSLAELKPGSSLQALGERFDHFEQRFNSALDDVATRADVEGLRLIESHIGELAAHLDQTQSQLARLDRIEAQFAELQHKLSDDQIVALFGGLVPTEEDLSRFAEDAASRVADRVIASLPSQTASSAFGEVAPAGRPDSKIDEVRGLLTSLIDERRRGEANTAEALETMQLAMQQVLDRIEAIETTRPEPEPAPQSFDEPLQRGDRPFGGDRARGARVNDPHVLAGEVRAFAEEAKAAAARASAGAGRPGPGIGGVDTRLEAGRGLGPQADMGLDEGSFDPPRAEASDRKQFLAMARQAAEKAHAQSQLAVAGPKGGAEPAGKGASLKDRLLKAPQGNAPKAGVRPGMLLAASVAAFVLFGAGYYVLGPKSRSAGPAVQRVQPTEAPGKASRSAPALIEDDAAIEPQGGAIQKQGFQGAPRARGQEQQASSEPHDANAAPAGAESPRQAPRAAETNMSTGALGIAIQDGRRDPTLEEMMRARQRAQLASLSERTAQNAARTSTVPDGAVPAGVREDGRAAPGAGRQMLEMPPLQIGPSSLRHAAAGGDASAQFEVAARFAEGKGVTQNFEQAAVWYERAASQGLAQAQYRLATLYERGLGVKGDLAKARLWYQKAALLGNLKAMHNLAVLSAGRDQGDPDYATASHWFTEAAEHGLADSQFNLGILNESGLGMPKDLVTAYKWYALAAAGGDKDATRRRDLLKAKLDPASLASAQEAVQSWRRRPSDPMVNEPRVAGDAWKRTAEQAR